MLIIDAQGFNQNIYRSLFGFNFGSQLEIKKALVKQCLFYIAEI
jgi:hypothetical protein